MLIPDLNAKSKNSHRHDKSSHKGNAIKNLTAKFGLKQIIKAPTHISITSSSFIDLTFTYRIKQQNKNCNSRKKVIHKIYHHTKDNPDLMSFLKKYRISSRTLKYFYPVFQRKVLR